MLQGTSSEESKVGKECVCYAVVFRRQRVGVDEMAQWLGVLAVPSQAPSSALSSHVG